MRHSMKNLLIALALTFLVTSSLVLVSTPSANAQDCLTELDGCHICVATDGTLDISGCGSAGGSTCPPFPASLLAADPDVEPGSLHALLVARAYARWTPGEPLYDVLADPRRLFVRREQLDVITDNPAVIGSGAEWRDAGLAAVKVFVVECLGYMRAVSVPDGTGGTRFAVLPPGSGTRGKCSGALLGWLPRQLGPFTDAELAPFVEPDRVAAAVDEDREELLVGLAAQLRELSAEDRFEVLHHAEFMGADPEGGRE